jgi:hypothetical protein
LVLLISLALFALNAAICAPLFRIEYLNQFGSNEGSYITFGAFLAQYWPHTGWFPWFNAGMPFEDTYLPLVPALVAIVSHAVRCSPAHAFHVIAAVAYSLAPVFLFLFARALSGRITPSAWAAVLWSVISPAIVFPDLLRDLGTPWGIRRLQNIVVYGETPHNVALCLLPLSLLLTLRFLSRPTARNFALASLAAAAVMLTNAFGVVVVSIASLFLFAARPERSLPLFGWLCGILLAAYLAIFRVLPPTLVRLIETNSQLVGGDYRFSIGSAVRAALFVAALALVWILLRRVNNPAVRFASLFTACFGGTTFLAVHGINLVPQPERYHIEMEAGICLLGAFLIAPIANRLPSGMRAGATIAFTVTLAWIATKDYQFARRIIHPADVAHAPEFEEPRWIAANLPDQRVLVSTDGEWTFNLIAANPQMGGGHEPSAPNFIQRVAVYTIYSGTNAGNQDAAISILWLKAFGCGAIVVPGATSKDSFHAVVNAAKFDGLLPVVWRDAGDSIYRVPLRSTSLAHVIPRAALVTRRPIHGLDVAQVRPYVAALEDPSKPVANLAWRDPDHGTIEAAVRPNEVVSVQITYDPGWQAHVQGKSVNLKPDQMGFITIDPRCEGSCSIDLNFDGGLERRIALTISIVVTIALFAMLFSSKALVKYRAIQ